MSALRFQIGELASVRRALDRRFCPKVRHASRGKAEAHIRHLAARSERRAEGLAAYECRFGCPAGTWHVGHVKE